MKVFIFISIVVVAILLKVSYVKQRDVRGFVNEHNDKLTLFAQQIYEEQQGSFELYDHNWEIPANVRKSIVYLNLSVKYIAVKKGYNDDPDYVWILLNHKPRDPEYYVCGIYYSPSGLLLDENRKEKLGDSYEYTGTYTRYRTEKIVANWYYYEEAQK